MKKIICILLLAATLSLTGCNLQTVKDLYCLPKRSETYMDLQNLMDEAMQGLEYSAPVSGVNLQTVQMADLDGDGNSEYLLFAKGTSEFPMHIFIFSASADGYFLLDTIQCSGSVFGSVQYAQIDGRAGMELIVGRRISEQITQTVSVYTLYNGQMEQLLSVPCTRFLCTNLDGNMLQELFILRPDENATGNGIAELYYAKDGVITRSAVAPMSRPAESIKRIMVSRLEDYRTAVYVASDVGGTSIVTDVYSIVDGKFSNVTLDVESDTKVDTLRSYYVFAEDIDRDEVLELPQLIAMRMPDDAVTSDSQHLIHWYALNSTGKPISKRYTYHNYLGGWYLQLNNDHAAHLTVSHQGSSYVFSIWNEAFTELEPLMTIYTLTGQKREEQAVIDNRFVLYRTESTVYAASLEVTAAKYGMSQQSLINSFTLIEQRWNSGES
jgi:hypothetical protein